MSVKVYNEKPAKKEKEFLLRLEQAEEGVNLVMVDSNGEEVLSGILLRITKDMRLERITYINDGLGLPLNEKRQLKLKEEEEEEDW